MGAYLIGGLFGSAFVAAAWALVISIRLQAHRFSALFGRGGRA
jgi:hypothetical protein